MYRCLLVTSTVQKEETRKRSKDLRLLCPHALTKMTSSQKDLRKLSILSKKTVYRGPGTSMLGMRRAAEGRGLEWSEEGRKCQMVTQACSILESTSVPLAFR